MYYQPGKTHHGLRYDPFKSCVIPRPIGWISTISRDGIHNLAPYSQFQMLAFDPPYVMFSAGQNSQGKRKDTVVNAEQTGQFVWNMATYDLREAVNKSAEEVPPEVDEFDLSGGVTKAASHGVKSCRVAESPVHFECIYHQTMRLPGNSVNLDFGRGVRARDRDSHQRRRNHGRRTHRCAEDPADRAARLS